MREYMIEDRADREQARSINEFYQKEKQVTQQPSFNLAERIKQVRAIEDMIDAKQAALNAELEKFNAFVERGRAEILQFLNQTNQKSANTQYGGCHWKAKITYRVEDKDAFRRHVIGSEAWELITWASAPVNCELFTDEHKQPPPGLIRNAARLLYITPPTKPKAKNKVVQDNTTLGTQHSPQAVDSAEQALVSGANPAEKQAAE
jgi:hypothetical protein